MERPGQHCHGGKKPSTPARTFVQSENEAGLLSKLDFILNEYDPTIIGGYNTNGFDIPYITDRAKRLGVSPLNVQGREIGMV